MRGATQSSKSPYMRYGKTPYQYTFKRCSHRRSDGRPNALYQQTAGWHGDVCAVCNIILKNLSRRSPDG